MKLVVIRNRSDQYGTFGELYLGDEYLCSTLEPSKHTQKKGAVPFGIYPLGKRTRGGFYWRYKKRFKDLEHKAMVQVKDVPNFKYILIHCGNKASDSRGCLLVGKRRGNVLVDSTETYKRIYKKLLTAAEIHYKT